MKEFKSTRLSFGLVSAPWLHCAVIHHHLQNEIQARPQHREMLDFVKENFYIDDITASCESVEEGNLVVDTLKEVFTSGCFPLKK